MTQYFSQLSEAEFQKLKDAIALITVYIAGVDGKINSKETAWAEKVTAIRAYKMSDDLLGFYQEVGKDFHDKLEEYIAKFSGEPSVRNMQIEEQLSALNPIMAKLDVKVGAHLYDSYRSFATHVAKATGGFLGFFTINAKEKAILDLKMIHPIVHEEDEEE